MNPCKKYANGIQKDQDRRRLSGLYVGHKKFTPQPSSHAKRRKLRKIEYEASLERTEAR